jgi:hypothetical protein
VHPCAAVCAMSPSVRIVVVLAAEVLVTSEKKNVVI